MHFYPRKTFGPGAQGAGGAARDGWAIVSNASHRLGRRAGMADRSARGRVRMKSTAMSASLDQSRQQLLHSAAERADHAGGAAVEQFLRTYYRHVATEDLLARAPEDLLGAAMAQRALAQERPVGTA